MITQFLQISDIDPEIYNEVLQVVAAFFKTCNRIRNRGIQFSAFIGLAVHTDHIFQYRGSVEVLVRFIFKVDEEPFFQFLWKIDIVLVRAAAQKVSVRDYKRISFPSLACSRTDNGFRESLSILQVKRILLRKASKLWSSKATRFRTLILLFRPSLKPLDFSYFQLFCM